MDKTSKTSMTTGMFWPPVTESKRGSWDANYTMTSLDNFSGESLKVVKDHTGPRSILLTVLAVPMLTLRRRREI